MNDIEKQLNKISPRVLSPEEKNRVWQGINISKQTQSLPSRSPLADLIKRPMFTTLAIALGVLIGAGGTAVAADNARPGDALFGIDRALERIELSLANDDSKDDVRLKIAEERLREIDDINDDSRNRSRNDEDDDDRRERISLGVSSLTSILADVRNEDRRGDIEDIIDELNLDLQSFPADARIEVRDDRFEVRTDEGRIRIEIKSDGEIRVRSDDNDNSGRGSDDDSDDRRGRDDDRDDDSRSSGSLINISGNVTLEAEADVFTDITTVEVELNDQKTTFTTNADTRAEVIDEILARFSSLTRAQVDAVLDLEFENRASRPQDLD